MKNSELIRILDAFTERFPHLAVDLCSDRGIYLMNSDSKMAAIIIRLFTRLNIPVLCIHDSFIIDYSKAKQLKVAMRAASRRVLGNTVPVSNNFQGLDEVEELTPGLVDDYMEIRHRPRCSAYQIRHRLFKERLAFLGLGR